MPNCRVKAAEIGEKCRDNFVLQWLNDVGVSLSERSEVGEFSVLAGWLGWQLAIIGFAVAATRSGQFVRLQQRVAVGKAQPGRKRCARCGRIWGHFGVRAAPPPGGGHTRGCLAGCRLGYRTEKRENAENTTGRAIIGFAVSCRDAIGPIRSATEARCSWQGATGAEKMCTMRALLGRFGVRAARWQPDPWLAWLTTGRPIIGFAVAATRSGQFQFHRLQMRVGKAQPGRKRFARCGHSWGRLVFAPPPRLQARLL